MDLIGLQNKNKIKISYMNRRQEERVADLGRAIQESLTDIINMENNDIQEERVLDLRYLNGRDRNEASVRREEVSERPTIGMNDRLAQYDINIKHVHNGFIVGVGCQTFVFESFDTLAKYMAIYYNDPQGTYEKHYKGELF